MGHFIIQVINLAINALIVWLVVCYYRGEHYPISKKYSTFWPRFWTGSVDSCVMWPISFLASALFMWDLPKVIGITLVVAQSLAWLFYTVIMHTKYGQTVGKMVCKVKVVDCGTEGAISFRQACLREGIPIAVSLGCIAYEIYGIWTGAISQTKIASGQIGTNRTFMILAMLPALWFVAEAITMLTNDKRRALHDYIAGTVVVRTNVM